VTRRRRRLSGSATGSPPPRHNPHPPVYDPPRRNPHPPVYEPPRDNPHPTENETPERDESEHKNRCQRLNAILVQALNDESVARDELERLKDLADEATRTAGEVERVLDQKINELGLEGVKILGEELIAGKAEAFVCRLARRLAPGVVALDIFLTAREWDSLARKAGKLRIDLNTAKEHLHEIQRDVRKAQSEFEKHGCKPPTE